MALRRKFGSGGGHDGMTLARRSIDLTFLARPQDVVGEPDRDLVRRFVRKPAIVNGLEAAGIVSVVVSEYAIRQSVQQRIEVALRRELGGSLGLEQRGDEALFPRDMPG